jgi:hypothetical protein
MVTSNDDLNKRIEEGKRAIEKRSCPTASEIDWTKRIQKIDPDSLPRPTYYGGADSTYEVFKVLEAWGLDKDFYLGNVLKYIARVGKKHPDDTKKELKKALVYLQRRLNSLE